MSSVQDFVARIEETCGEERDFVVIFKYDRKDMAIRKILEKAELKKSISRVIFELRFKDVSFRLYGTGKAIFRDLKGKSELEEFLADLLS